MFPWASSEVSSAFNLTALHRAFAPLCTAGSLLTTDYPSRCLRLSPSFRTHRHRKWHGTQRGKRLGSTENGASAFCSTQAIGQDWKGRLPSERVYWDTIKIHQIVLLIIEPPTVNFWSSHHYLFANKMNLQHQITSEKKGLFPHPHTLHQRWAGLQQHGQEGRFLSYSSMQGACDPVNSLLLCGNALSFACSLSSLPNDKLFLYRVPVPVPPCTAWGVLLLLISFWLVNPFACSNLLFVHTLF